MMHDSFISRSVCRVESLHMIDVALSLKNKPCFFMHYANSDHLLLVVVLYNIFWNCLEFGQFPSRRGINHTFFSSVPIQVMSNF